MKTATNCLNLTAGLPGFSAPDANELERIDGGDKCVIYTDAKTGKGAGLCMTDDKKSLYWVTVTVK
jgi:hypothetical protein